MQFEEHKFYSLLQAEKEAKRLAIENTNYEFFVLESVGVAAVTDAVYTKF